MSQPRVPAGCPVGTGANGNTFKGNFPTVEGNVAGNSITGQK